MMQMRKKYSVTLFRELPKVAIPKPPPPPFPLPPPPPETMVANNFQKKKAPEIASSPEVTAQPPPPPPPPPTENNESRFNSIIMFQSIVKGKLPYNHFIEGALQQEKVSLTPRSVAKCQFMLHQCAVLKKKHRIFIK